LVDGVSAPLLTVNTVMRGIALPPGAHAVALTFSPPGLLAGLALSLAGALGLLFLAGGPTLLRARHPRPAPHTTRRRD
jgi:uncharacterized membrane protein YfhO